MNDWEIKKFLRIILALQLAVWGVIGLDLINLNIPILRQIIALVYLTFIPGILIIRILKLHKLGNIKVILYSIGLSLSTLMFTGFFMNAIFPLIGIDRPISLYPLVLVISILVLILSFFAYIRDQSFSSPEHILLEEMLSPQVLILSLFPITAIIGTSLFNSNGNNIVLMTILLLIAFVPVVLLFTKFFQEKYYPYIIFILTITLLFSHSLISAYIWGWDINSEYFLVNAVIQNGLWDSTLFGNLNAMLSLSILGPIYSIILYMNLDGIFKIIYPMLFAFVPLGLYAIFRKQADSKVAFLACFFFISLFVFYTEMLTLARQEIAELFLVLIILSMIDNNLKRISKSVFFLLFSSALVVSHYGLSYLFLLILVIAWAIASVGHYLISKKSIHRFFVWFLGKSGDQIESDLQKYFSHSGLFSFSYVLYYSVFLLVWYVYTAGSSSFNSIVLIGNHIITSASSELLNTETTEGLSLITTTDLSIVHEIGRDMHILTIFLIIIGFLSSVFFYKKVQLDLEYLLLSFGALCLCMGGVVLPYFSSSLNTSRLYQISLIFLAPFCVLGGIAIFQIARNFFISSNTNNGVKISLQVLSIFFAVFMLINSGWFYEIANDHPIALMNDTIDFPIVNVQQVSGAIWLTDLVDAKSIYADEYRRLFFNRIYGPRNIRPIPTDLNKIQKQSYVFIGNFNIKNKRVLVTLQPEYLNTSYILSNRSRIYDSGGAEIYYR
jgi:uncharacterized membrane protein